MRIQHWEKAPFKNDFGDLRFTEKTTHPFTVGAITRQGFGHAQVGLNNQDTLNVYFDDKVIVGVVCDGCTSGEASLISDFSRNEFAAVLFSRVIVSTVARKLTTRKYRLGELGMLRLLSEIEKQLSKSINPLLRVFSTQGRSDASALRNLFSTTVMCFAVAEKEFMIFSCGDGQIQINNKDIDLSDQDGEYYNPLYSQAGVFTLNAFGDVANLNSLCLATDGFSPVWDRLELQNMINKHRFPVNGIVDLTKEFHKTVLNEWGETKPFNWPSDDASMILLRRNSKQDDTV